MASRRSRGDGTVYWSESRQRWIVELTIGYRPNGKRIFRKASGKTKTEAKNKLKELIRDVEEGAANASAKYTVEQAVNDWLVSYERGERDPNTVKAVRSLVNNHIVPAIGARPLVKLEVDDVEEWLAEKAEVLVTSTLRNLRSILRRAINRAQVRKRVRYNVVLLCDELPAGRGTGRPSKALTLAQAEAVLAAAESSPMRAYIVVSLLTGARTEEMRPLTWDHVDLVGKPDATAGDPAERQGVAFGPRPRRDEDEEVATHAGTARTSRQGAGSAPSSPAGGQGCRGRRLARTGACVRNQRGHRAGRQQRPARLPPVDQGSRAQPDPVDAPGAATQLRLDPLGRRDADRGDLAVGRAQQHCRYGAGLPKADPAGGGVRGDRNGPAFPRDGGTCGTSSDHQSGS